MTDPAILPPPDGRLHGGDPRLVPFLPATEVLHYGEENRVHVLT
jgi:hypothetical protein